MLDPLKSLIQMWVNVSFQPWESSKWIFVSTKKLINQWKRSTVSLRTWLKSKLRLSNAIKTIVRHGLFTVIGINRRHTIIAQLLAYVSNIHVFRNFVHLVRCRRILTSTTKTVFLKQVRPNWYKLLSYDRKETFVSLMGTCSAMHIHVDCYQNYN